MQVQILYVVCMQYVVIRAHGRNLRAVVHITTKLQLIVNSIKRTNTQHPSSGHVLLCKSPILHLNN